MDGGDKPQVTIYSYDYENGHCDTAIDFTPRTVRRSRREARPKYRSIKDESPAQPRLSGLPKRNCRLVTGYRNEASTAISPRNTHFLKEATRCAGKKCLERPRRTC